MALSETWRRALAILCVCAVFVHAQPTGSPEAMLSSPAAPSEQPAAATVPAASAASAAPAASAASAASPAPQQPASMGAVDGTSPASQNISAFFPQINGDLTKVTWAHAVNTQALLKKSLNSSVLMLEADVILGTTLDNPQKAPVMGHPPMNSSDLSLRQFLRDVVEYNKVHENERKGIKLDFKSIDVFEEAIAELHSTFGDVPSFPVWLNADILSGPVNATATPVDPTRFLAAAKKFPSLMLSLGWTTRWGTGLDGQKVPASEGVYTQADVQNMEKTILESGVTQPITYAVRAAFVANSLDMLSALLKNTSVNDATLSVWMSDDTDELVVADLKKSILAIGRSRVYLDVPEKVAKELNLSGNSAVRTASASLLSSVFALMVMFCGRMGTH